MKKFFLWSSLLLVFSCNCDQSSGGQQIKEDAKVEAPAKVNPAEAQNTGAPGGTSAPGSYTKTPEQKMIEDGRKGNASEEEINKKMESKFTMKKEQAAAKSDKTILPPSCSFLPEAWINKYFGQAPNTIKVKDASAANQPTVKSCFFRWDNGLIPNSGIFLQLQGNPYPDEIPAYATTFMEGKLEKGEAAMGEQMTHYPYKKFDVADGGAYSAEQGKFFWRIGDEHVFMLAFNLGMDKKSEFKYATDLSKQIMKEYRSKFSE